MEDAAHRADIFAALGREAAKLHDASDAWTPPPAFGRAQWDRAGLLGDAPLWGRFWENPRLSPEDAAFFMQFRGVAETDLVAIESDLDFGLIHADLLGENVLVEGDHISLIDFDDGGWGFRVFEAATALIKWVDAPDYADLRAAFLDGYRSVRQMDVSALPACVWRCAPAPMSAGSPTGWTFPTQPSATGSMPPARGGWPRNTWRSARVLRSSAAATKLQRWRLT